MYYFIGDFDAASGRFTPDESMGGLPRLLDFGSNVFTGPSVLTDPVTGRVCMFSIMQDQRTGPEEGAAGWAHCAGLTRNLYLNDDGTDVCTEPDPRLYSLLGENLLEMEDVGMEEANEALQSVGGDLLYVRVVMEPQDSHAFGFICKAGGRRNQTVFTYDADRGTLDGYTSNRGKGSAVSVVAGSVPLKDGALTMELFIDRSLVEAFFNGDKAVSVRSYAAPECREMRFFSDGGLRIRFLQAAPVASIYE